MLVPAIIYLDSQDFSRFSPSHFDYDEYVPLRRELKELKQKGLARFAFSDVHIWEALPSDPENSAAGLERVRTIAEFCEGAHLPSASTLVEHELHTLTSKHPGTMWTAWYPYFELERLDRKRITGEVVSGIAQNRKQRRVLQKALRRPTDTQVAGRMATEFLAKYPFLCGSKQVFQSYFAHQVEWDAVERALRGGLSDIVGFSEWLVGNWTHGERFIASLRASNQYFQDALIQLFDKMRGLFEQSCMTEDEATGLISTVYAEQRQGVLELFLNRCGEKFLGESIRRQNYDPVDPSQAPSLTTALQFVTDLAYRSSLPKRARNPGKRAASDFADALHTLFLPRVDVFRADRFTCDLLRRAPQIGRARLCASLIELPALIKEANSRWA